MRVRKAIIPAAGLGTRLLPNTKSIPKEMLPLVDKPVIQYIVEEAVAAGVEQILIITNRGKSPIEDYFDYAPDLEERLLHDGKRDEARTVRAVADMADVFFLRQKETKGLGHAIWRAKSFVGDEPFGVLLGDDIMLSEKPVLKQAFLQVGGIVKVVLDGVLAPVGDDEDLLHACGHSLLHDVLDHGLVHQGQHLLGNALGVGQKTGPQSRRGNDGFPNAHDDLLSPPSGGSQSLLKRSIKSRMALIRGSCRIRV